MYILIIIMREYHENIFDKNLQNFPDIMRCIFNTCTSILMILGKAANNIAHALEILQSCTKPLISNAMIIALFTRTLTLTVVMLNFTAGKGKYIGILYDFLKLRMHRYQRHFEELSILQSQYYKFLWPVSWHLQALSIHSTDAIIPEYLAST